MPTVRLNPNNVADPKLERFRQLLLPLIVLGIVGLIAELFLLEHTESAFQWVPLVALTTGLLGSVWVWMRPSDAAVRFFRLVMGASVVIGATGLFLHLNENVEFEREIDSSVGGFDLFWAAMHGATPTLAPGALMQLGLLGLLYAYRHPALIEQSAEGRPA